MEKKTYYNSFTALRLFGAFCVLFSHSFDLLKEPEPFEEFFGIKLSKIGLWIFFSISGYLISSSAIHSKSGLSYFWKRVVRIFPALVVVVILTILLVGPAFTSLSIWDYYHDGSTLSYLKNIVLYRNQYSLPGVFKSNVGGTAVNGSLWTLAYEFSFYLIVVFLIYIPKSIHKAYGIVFLILSFGMFFWGRVNPNLTVPFLYLNIKSLGEFGVLFAMGICYQFFVSKNHVLNGYIDLILYAFIVLLLFYFPDFLVFFFSPFIIYVGLKKSWFSSLDDFGDISYGVYLYAFPIQQIIIQEFPEVNAFILMLQTLVISCFVAYLSWSWIEKPSLKLKNLI